MARHVWLLAAAALWPLIASAQQAAPELPNIPLRTASYSQFWTDEFVYLNWRIQRNCYTGHCRLLDDRNFRREWGAYEVCQTRFEELKQQHDLPPLKAKCVVLLHGLIRYRETMQGLGSYLEEQGGYTPLCVSYASTRRSLDEHAASLALVLDRLKGPEEIDFVCHSLGNLVLRRYLAGPQQPGEHWSVDKRIRRIVMLAPPNQGASLAELFKNDQLFGLLLGPSGKQIARDWKELEKRLATPQQQFGILAGTAGVNPLIDGVDDFVLGLNETRLPGARDFATFPVHHGQLMDDAASRRAVLRFLRDGYFRTEAERRPIPAAEAAGR